MVEVHLEPEVEERLERLAAEIQVSKSFFAREAIERFVEDREDYFAGIRAISASKSTIGQEEMERQPSVAN